MKAVLFPEQNVIAARDQVEFKALPGFHGKVPGWDGKTEFVCCYELSENEIMKVRATGKIWLRLYTGGGNIQPHIVTVDNPFTSEFTK